MMKRQLTILDREIPSIDLFRLIAAFLVVTVHVKPRPFDELIPGVSYLTTSVFARAALMFFFVVSGFFLAKRVMEKGPASVWRFVGRLWGSYTIWFVIYFWFNYKETIQAGINWADFLPQVALDYFLWGGDLQLWFLPALCICCILFWAFSLIRCQWIYFILSVPLAAIGLLANPYRAIGRMTFLEPFFNSSLYSPLRRIFFMGMPVFLIGGILYATLDRWMRMRKETTDALMLVSLSLFMAEPALLNRFSVNNGLMITLFLYPLEFFLLLWCIRNPMPKLEPYAAAMRYDAAGIYYSHYLFIFAVGTLSEFGGSYVDIFFDSAPTLQYALVMLFTLCFVGIVRRSRFRAVRRLLH